MKEKGFEADFLPSHFDGETLKRELPGDGTALLLGAAKPDVVGPDTRFRTVGLYQTVTRTGPADISTDYVVFASAGGVRIPCG